MLYIYLEKYLKDLGFSKSALICFKTYLEDRQLRVISKTPRSEPPDINLAVPQGFVLGPLLFCLCMNDIKSQFDQNTFYLLYVNDLQVYIQVSPECVLEEIKKINMITRSVSQWVNKVSLLLNPDKTKVIYFGSGIFVDRLNKLQLPGVDMGNGIILPFVQEVKNLGVILDCRLSWESHITSIKKMANRVLYTLRFIRGCTSEMLRKRLIQALVTPNMDYCIVILLDGNASLKTRIQRLSNTGLCYVFGICRDTHISHFKKKLNWLTTDARRTHFFLRHKPRDTARG